MEIYLITFSFFNCARSFTTEEKSLHIYIGVNVLHAISRIQYM